LGGFYFNEDQDTSTWLHLLNVSDTLFASVLNTESYAAFGEVNYSLTDKLRGIAGVRYTSETKAVDGFQFLIPGSVGCTVPGAGPGGSCQTLHIVGKYDAKRTNYRVGFEYDVAPNNMLFATVATGFKSGGQVNADLPPYQPEDLTAYTIGSRNRFFDNSLQINGELFYMDYKNHQENFSVLDRRGRQVQALLNAGTATSKGASLETVWRPTANDEIRVGAEYTKAEYGTFQYFAYNTGAVAPPSTGCPVTRVLPIPAGVTATGVWSVDCAGFQMARTPTWSGTAGYSHVFPLANGGDIEFAPDLTFASSRWVEAAFVPNDRAESYVVYNASLTYHAPKDRYSLQAFVRNISEEAVYTGGQQDPFLNGYVGLNIADPRTYGARLRVNF
jgi:iron complex outermembrane receptor protein